MHILTPVSKKGLFILFMSIMTCSWAQKIDSKYLISIIYLQSDKELNEKVKKAFKKETQRSKSINFQVSKKISFLDPKVFDNELKKEGVSFSDKKLESKYKSIDNHFRKVFSNEKKNDKIFIHFSKPIGNLLLIELSTKDFSDHRIKLGKSLRVLFLFDEKGFIKRVYTKTIYNN